MRGSPVRSTSKRAAANVSIRCFSVPSGSCVTNSTLGRRKVTARSNRISPRLSARIKPDRLRAPAAVKLACTRIWLLPCSSATRFDPSSLPSALMSTVPVTGFRRRYIQVDGKLFAGECQRGKAHRFQAQVRTGAAFQRESIDGDAEVLGLPGRARDAAGVFVSIGDQNQAREPIRREAR